MKNTNYGKKQYDYYFEAQADCSHEYIKLTWLKLRKNNLLSKIVGLFNNCGACGYLDHGKFVRFTVKSYDNCNGLCKEYDVYREHQYAPNLWTFYDENKLLWNGNVNKYGMCDFSTFEVPNYIKSGKLKYGKYHKRIYEFGSDEGLNFELNRNRGEKIIERAGAKFIYSNKWHKDSYFG